MAIKKIQMIPPGYTDIVHPETSADNIIETDSKKIMTGDERTKLGSIPSDAVFTDTITTINGKTGAISKADIVALGIPSQDTIVDISGKADKTYVDNKVKTDVPSGAKFTDTVYTHPASHPASMITGLPNSLPADGGNADTVGGFTVGVSVPADAKFTDTVTTINGKTGAIVKADIVALGIPAQDTVVDISGKADTTYVDGKVKTDVPSGAKFTDTITTINGKTGAISKADITALGIPAQDTVYTHPPGTNPHGTTKSDVGLGNVTNDKQMPISDGVLENYTERLDASDNEIDVGSSSVWIFYPSRNATLEFVNTPQKADVAASVTVIVKISFEITPIIFPPSVKWQGGEIPDMSEVNKTYVLTFMTIDGGTTWFGMFGGEF